ncbi:HD-GYP domain-containing protein [Desulfovibrio inopinatus]|uniref:HD-GYP domain-containing protein n=1 Tax=Desulfovibrio inopinatus TaxID=102109 RepID=UPI000409B915|nr:HD domain-containing phosphohydrolase [Desulfovibrio inopinatus]
MSEKKSLDIPENLDEEFYQINNDILQSFSKYRPPLNIYRFREDVQRIVTYYEVGNRLSKHQTEELPELVDEGVIFVSRVDHSIYVKHISYQLDLVLLDKHLTERETADIFQMAITRRMEAFFEQPVKMVYDKLQADIFVLTEYLWEDINRGRALVRRFHKEHTLANHSVNCGFFGLLLFLYSRPKDFCLEPKNRQLLNRIALGLFLHDIGMSKIPPFIRDKTQPLTPDDRQKIQNHPNIGHDMLSKLDIKYPEIEQCVLQHHERLDGSGYPGKRKNGDITTWGNLAAVVDSYCAMRTQRPYAQALDPAAAAQRLADDRRYEGEWTKRILPILVKMKENR